MFDGLLALLKSKKFWLTILGTAVTAGLTMAHAPQEVILVVAGLFGTNVAAQGFADFNKKPE
jgi:hypothetical protein